MTILFCITFFYGTNLEIVNKNHNNKNRIIEIWVFKDNKDVFDNCFKK